MWNILESVKQGRSHVKHGIPCQDKTFSQSYDGTYVIALADGAGSASLSHYGAECVVRCVTDELGMYFESYWNEQNARIAKERLFNVLYEALQKQADLRECELKDLASTLLVVAVKDERYLMLHVGDGVIGYHDEEGLKVASAPNNGEFANTTIFVTSSDACGQARILKGHLGSITGFVLMSDGPEACLYNHQTKALADGLLEILNDIASKNLDVVSLDLDEAMNSVIVQYTMDDCSLVLMERKSVAKESAEVKLVNVECPLEELADEVETIDVAEDNTHQKEAESSNVKYIHSKYLIVLLVILVIILYIFL